MIKEQSLNSLTVNTRKAKWYSSRCQTHKKTITRLTFYARHNQVRQHFGISSDDGKTWTTTVDLMYNQVN